MFNTREEYKAARALLPFDEVVLWNLFIDLYLCQLLEDDIGTISDAIGEWAGCLDDEAYAQLRRLAADTPKVTMINAIGALLPFGEADIHDVRSGVNQALYVLQTNPDRGRLLDLVA